VNLSLSHECAEAKTEKSFRSADAPFPQRGLTPFRGKEEMTNRRIGFDEISAIAACRAYVEAQEEYRRLDREGNGLREYAKKIISTPGTLNRRRVRPTSRRSTGSSRTPVSPSVRARNQSSTTATTSASSPRRGLQRPAAPFPTYSKAI
jgi:hypothetical protein